MSFRIWHLRFVGRSIDTPNETLKNTAELLMVVSEIKKRAWCWFQTIFMFTPTWGNYDPVWTTILLKPPTIFRDVSQKSPLTKIKRPHNPAGLELKTASVFIPLLKKKAALQCVRMCFCVFSEATHNKSRLTKCWGGGLAGVHFVFWRNISQVHR